MTRIRLALLTLAGTCLPALAYADTYRITQDWLGSVRIFLDWELLWIYLGLPSIF